MRGAVFGAHLAAISVARIGLTERISHAESLMLRIVLSSLLTAVLLAAASAAQSKAEGTRSLLLLYHTLVRLLSPKRILYSVLIFVRTRRVILRSPGHCGGGGRGASCVPSTLLPSRRCPQERWRHRQRLLLVITASSATNTTSTTQLSCSYSWLRWN